MGCRVVRPGPLSAGQSKRPGKKKKPGVLRSPGQSGGFDFSLGARGQPRLQQPLQPIRASAASAAFRSLWPDPISFCDAKYKALCTATQPPFEILAQSFPK